MTSKLDNISAAIVAAERLMTGAAERVVLAQREQSDALEVIRTLRNALADTKALSHCKGDGK